jgi:DNA-nicking Smr family endonuclease
LTDNTDEILSHIEKFGIFNKDRYGGCGGKKKSTKKQKATSHKQNLRETLDLHGLVSAEAAIRLRMTVYRCKERGIKELLVIHGIGYHSHLSGGPVLKLMVKQMLENELCCSVRDSKPALPKDGGDGATLIYF